MRFLQSTIVDAQDVIPDDAVQVELIKVIDGDTIDVDFDLGSGEDLDRVRMIGIDPRRRTTPSETILSATARKPAKRPTACW